MVDGTLLGAGSKVKNPELKGKLIPIKDHILAYNMNFGERTSKGGIYNYPSMEKNMVLEVLVPLGV